MISEPPNLHRDITVRPISLDLVRCIRHAVLRPGKPFETTLWPGDEEFSTIHFGVYLKDILVGVASLYKASPPGTILENAWQLRGMAVLEKYQRQGLGSRLVEECIAHLLRQHGRLIWCNARVHACGFYQRHGFIIEGEPFEIPGIGPHYRMKKTL